MTRQQLASLQQRRFTASWDDEGRKPHFYFNAFASSELVGLADLIAQRSQWDGYAMVEPLYVHPRCWRHGVGMKLWRTCASVGSSLGAKGLHVVSLDQNEVAKPFYEKRLGLRQVSSEWLMVEDGHVFPATRYEVPNWDKLG
ncbi:MAG TPA: GNAT family N-acetyltransferase [Candidatus Dormibacteraeota bacterium]